MISLLNGGSGRIVNLGDGGDCGAEGDGGGLGKGEVRRERLRRRRREDKTDKGDEGMEIKEWRLEINLGGGVRWRRKESVWMRGKSYRKKWIREGEVRH